MAYSVERNHYLPQKRITLMGKKVYYIGWYIADEDRERFSGNVPGNLKMHYVVDQLKKSGNTPVIISFARKNDKSGLYITQISSSQGCSLRYIGGVAGNGRVLKRLDILLKELLLILMFLFKFREEDTIVLYHSVSITRLVAKLRKIVKRHVILEVEEIYGYAAVGDRPWVKKEIETVKVMDAHICVNDGMLHMLSLKPEKFVANYGVGVFPERRSQRFSDGKVHVVYAGTIEMKKLGALTAVESAAFFPENYILHILGFGTDENMNKLKEKINDVNSKAGCVKVEYNGYKSGPELDDFLFSCHIGLSSNVMRPNFANNTFPSKVITYMCHDLSVVLGYAEAFYDVPISQGWSFYHEFKPEKIAEAVASVEIKPIGYYQKYINQMNDDLQSFLKKNC